MLPHWSPEVHAVPSPKYSWCKQPRCHGETDDGSDSFRWALLSPGNVGSPQKRVCQTPLLILWAVINSAVFAEGMGGVAVEDEMEKRKHTECHLRLSAFLCVPVSDVRFGRRWQGAERSKLKQWKQNVLNLSSITRAFSLRLPHSVSRFFSLSVALLQRRLWAVQGVCVCVCVWERLWLAVCVWASRGPTRETLTSRRRSALNKAHAWQLEEPVSAARN